MTTDFVFTAHEDGDFSFADLHEVNDEVAAPANEAVAPASNPKQEKPPKPKKKQQHRSGGLKVSDAASQFLNGVADTTGRFTAGAGDIYSAFKGVVNEELQSISVSFNIRHVDTLASILNDGFDLDEDDKINGEQLLTVINAGMLTGEETAMQVVKILNDVTAYTNEHAHNRVLDADKVRKIAGWSVIAGIGVFCAAAPIVGIVSAVGLVASLATMEVAAITGVALVNKGSEVEPSDQQDFFEREADAHLTLKEKAAPLFEKGYMSVQAEPTIIKAPDGTVTERKPNFQSRVIVGLKR